MGQEIEICQRSKKIYVKGSEEGGVTLLELYHYLQEEMDKPENMTFAMPILHPDKKTITVTPDVNDKYVWPKIKDGEIVTTEVVTKEITIGSWDKLYPYSSGDIVKVTHSDGTEEEGIIEEHKIVTNWTEQALAAEKVAETFKELGKVAFDNSYVASDIKTEDVDKLAATGSMLKEAIADTLAKSLVDNIDKTLTNGLTSGTVTGSFRGTGNIQDVPKEEIKPGGKMAVKIKIDSDKILEAFQLLIMKGKMDNVGVYLEVDTKGIYIKGKQMENTFAMVPVKPGALSMAMKNTLGPASLSAISYKLKKEITSAIKSATTYKSETIYQEEEGKYVKEEIPPTKWPDGAKIGGVPAGEELPANMYEKLKKNVKDATAEVGATGDIFADIKSLKDATELLQPCSSTSAGSVYFMVFNNAKYSGIKVAARYKGSTLSLRAESVPAKKLEQNQEILKKAGFGLSNLSAGYVSVHFSINNQGDALRTLGAVLFTLNSELGVMEPMPDFKKVINKGV